MNKVEKYVNRIKEAVGRVDSAELQKFHDIIESQAARGKHILVCGNGGSASIAEHFSCDHTKGIAIDTNLKPFVVSLTSNISLITAIANDIGYDEVFAKQIEFFNDPDSVLIVVSSSGNSPNIIRALQSAKKIGMVTMAMVGFTGGRVLKEQLADVCLYVPWHNYGVVEDAHSVIMHSIAQDIRSSYARPDASLKL